jgi:hypothetical protein
MLLIAVTNWRHKAGVIIRLLLFLALICLITPQFFNFISGHIASFKNRQPAEYSQDLRVQQPPVELEQQPAPDQGDLLLKKLEDMYFGSGKQAPPE